VAAEVRIQGVGETLTVPTAALVGNGAGAHVLVFAPGAKAGEPSRLSRVPIKVLIEGANRTSVQAALAPGDRVVVGQTAVLAQLRDGDAAVTASQAGTGQ